MKLSPAKFKILDIMAHGGKWNNNWKNSFPGYDLPNDASWAAMSVVNQEVFSYDHIKYILGGRRPDEYFFVHIGSCFGGGLVEDHIHNDVTNKQGYTSISASSELGTNYCIMVADNANSPSWGYGDNANDDLFEFSLGDSYGQQEAEINQVVQQCRSQNLALLREFLQKHYVFMRDTLLSNNWDDASYSESMDNAENLIMQYSKEYSHIEQFPHLLKSPMVFLFCLLFEYNLPSTMNYFGFYGTPKSKKEFFDQHYAYSCAKFESSMGSVKTSLKDSVGVNPAANKFLNIWDPEKWDGVEDETTYYEFWDNLLSDEQEYTRELRGNLMQFIDFFYDLYILTNEINENSRPVRKRNWVAYAPTILSALATLLDDSPKMLFSGGQDFASCKFPEFPNMPKPVETEDLREKKLIY